MWLCGDVLWCFVPDTFVLGPVHIQHGPKFFKRLSGLLDALFRSVGTLANCHCITFVAKGCNRWLRYYVCPCKHRHGMCIVWYLTTLYAMCDQHEQQTKIPVIHVPSNSAPEISRGMLKMPLWPWVLQAQHIGWNKCSQFPLLQKQRKNN